MDSLVAAMILGFDTGLPPDWSTSAAGIVCASAVWPLASAGSGTFEAFGAVFPLRADFWAGIEDVQAVSDGFSRHAGIWAAALLA